MRHRGPDGKGVFLDQRGATHCGLAHRRLAILDLSHAADQPMTSQNGRYVICYNGEVFNFAEVRKELESAGVVFRTSGDTEVILEAYARWGQGALQRFRGMFAMAIWDRAEQSLFLARDRMGIKPLYWSLQQGVFCFASEVRTLLDASGMPRHLSVDALYGYLRFGSVPAPHAMVEGVEVLPAGHTMILRNGRVQIEAYWRLPVDVSAASQSLSFEAAREQLAPVLRDAVRLRLIADVPVGLFLSGGIDSSVLAAIASQESSQPVRTFSVGFGERDFDESSYARIVAERFGCQHEELRVEPNAMLRELPAVLQALDQPSIDGLNTYCVSQAVRRAGLTVALSGLGGDELFAGYNYARRFLQLAKAARALRTVSPGALGGRVRTQILDMAVRGIAQTQPLDKRLGPAALLQGWVVRSTVRRQLEKLAALGTLPLSERLSVYEVLRSLFPAPATRGLVVEKLQLGVPALMTAAPVGMNHLCGEGDELAAYLALEATNYMRHTLLSDSDVMSMAHSLELRVPLLDHRLVETVMRMPMHLKLSPKVNKPLLLAAAPDLPSEAVYRNKMGFAFPMDRWCQHELSGWIDEALGPEALGSLGVIRPEAAQALWTQFRTHGPAANLQKKPTKGAQGLPYTQVWGLAVLGDWARRNRILPPRELILG